VDCAAATVSGEEFREGGMEVIRNKGGDDIFVAVRNHKEVTGACHCEVVPPARTRENARLRTIGTGGSPFCIGIHSLGF